MVFVPTLSGQAALKEISQVEWAGMKHAYSGADDDFSIYAVPLDDFHLVFCG